MITRLGILGGTFNPIHRGHVRMARLARARFKLDRVLFMPCARPPHKKAPDLAPARHRLAMIRLALRKQPGLSVSRLELQRGGPSYTIATIKMLQSRHPGVRLFFIIGADSLTELHAWKQVDELLERCVFITVARPGFSLRNLTARRLRLKAPWPSVLTRTVIRGRGIDVSSTEIRRRAARGLNFRRLVPAAVADYIEKKRLYRGKETSRSKRWR